LSSSVLQQRRCSVVWSDLTKIASVTVLNVHGMHTSAGCPKQGLGVLAAMPTVGEIGSADLCG